ncbi:hypothetical protein D0Y53_03385 [Luteimonas weifangensis]|uniref:Uncharacterized protein n=1 Tax=Cognatiluteimonas weifangensis TaxID=2303539 RepID=A0A372DPG1_9GAMM|nr:hypothetical protein D0Y53_03385 [Luteimonas weifangensis]
MKNLAIRLKFGSFVKLMTLGCFCGSLVMVPINALISSMEGSIGSSGYLLILGPVGGVLIGLILGVAGYPIYSYLTRKFQWLQDVIVHDEVPTDGSQIAP